MHPTSIVCNITEAARSRTSPILPVSKSSANSGGAMDSRRGMSSRRFMVVCWLGGLFKGWFL